MPEYLSTDSCPFCLKSALESGGINYTCTHIHTHTTCGLSRLLLVKEWPQTETKKIMSRQCAWKLSALQVQYTQRLDEGPWAETSLLSATRGFRTFDGIGCQCQALRYMQGHG